VDNAARTALAHNQSINMFHLRGALKGTKPSLTEQQIAEYKQFSSLERK